MNGKVTYLPPLDFCCWVGFFGFFLCLRFFLNLQTLFEITHNANQIEFCSALCPRAKDKIITTLKSLNKYMTSSQV